MSLQVANSKPTQGRNVAAKIAICVLALLTPVIFYWIFVRPSHLSPIRRTQLTSFASQVKIGDSKKRVETIFQSGFSSSSIRFREHNSETWVYETPLEFGAKNWYLVISFDANGVDGVGIRSADSLKFRPSEAPIDRVRPGSESSWRKKFGS